MNKKYTIIVILLPLIMACTNSALEEQNKDEYEIISLLYEGLAERLPAPPPPILKRMSIQDSIKTMKRHIKIRDSLLSLTHVVAVDSVMRPVQSEFSYERYSEEQNKLIESLKSLKDHREISIERIKNPRNDSIIKLEKHHIDDMSSDYFYFDKLISFSRIAFNYNKTKAVVVAGGGTSQLASMSAVFFLQKKEGKWTIVHWETLTIS